MATSLADHRAGVRTGRNRWSTSQHFRPTQAMCGPAALVHSSTDLLGSQTCNRVIPWRTGLSSTHISDNVCMSMECIKNELKGLAQAKIIKKSVILFWLLNMTIWCKHVHRLELQKFLNFCAAHSPVRLDIETKFLICIFWQPCQKLEIREFRPYI